MPLPVFDTQDAIPEAFRAEYVEREDAATPGVKKWHPNVPAVEDVSGLKSTLDKKKAEAKAEKERADALQRKIDAAALTQEAKAKGISDEELQKIRDAEEKARKPIVDERDALKAENRKLKLDDKARALGIKYGVMGDRIDDAMDAALKRLDLSDQGNLVVKDASGAITTQTPESFFETTFKTEKPWFYAGTGSSGSGATGSTASGSGGSTTNTVDSVAANKRATGAFSL